MVDQIRFFAGAARLLEGRAATEYMAGHTSYMRREPVGVCAAVTPWNYPMMMAVWKWAPAIAAGNTMVIKPSETTPASTLMLAEIWLSTYRRGCSTWSVATGTRAALWWPTEIPAMVSITGSVRAGMEVAAVGMPADLKRVHLELGGQSASDRLRRRRRACRLLEGIAVAAFFNAGQDCTAATRVLVGPGIHTDFLDALVEQARGTVVGPFGQDDANYGPLNNVNQLDRVRGIYGARSQLTPRCSREESGSDRTVTVSPPRLSPVSNKRTR